MKRLLVLSFLFSGCALFEAETPEGTPVVLDAAGRALEVGTEKLSSGNWMDALIASLVTFGVTGGAGVAAWKRAKRQSQ